MNNIGLLNYVINQYSKPNVFMYGAFGQNVTDKFINIKKNQYPNYYTSTRVNILKNNIGKRAFDCIGLIKAYYWEDGKNYNDITDVSANDLYNKALIKGTIDTIDRSKKGLCVHMNGHVGVYDGNNGVYECTISNNAYKIVHTLLDGRGWINWLECPYISYVNDITAPAMLNTNIYIVKKDDNLADIAKKNNTTWQIIYEKNKDVIGNNPNLIYPGQRLVI